MTPASQTETNPSFAQHLGYLSGNWLAYRDMRIGVNDLGLRQGVTAVERLRTYAGRIFALDAHLDRWDRTVAQLRIDGMPSGIAFKALIENLLAKNDALVRAEGDVGVTMFATPGAPDRAGPTIALHLNPLNHAANRRRQEHGQPLVLTDVRQPDPACWPRWIKVRCRLHYYLADAKARDVHEDAVGILIDDDGSVTETSIANLAIVQSGRIISPPAARVLGGITQSMVESLAAEAAIEWSKSSITAEQLRQADEILMMGTNGGIWYANSIDDQPVGSGLPAEVYRCLRKRFDDFVRLQ